MCTTQKQLTPPFTSGLIFVFHNKSITKEISKYKLFRITSVQNCNYMLDLVKSKKKVMLTGLFVYFLKAV